MNRSLLTRLTRCIGGLRFPITSSLPQLYQRPLYSSSATEESQTLDEDNNTAVDSTAAVEKGLVKKYKVNQGGDVNMASLLGTVIGVKITPMHSNPERDWAVIFLRTRVPKSTQPSPIDTNLAPGQQQPQLALSTTSSRVHVFDPRLLNNVKRIKSGDRLFIHGFLAYFRYDNNNNNTTDDSSGGGGGGAELRSPKTCAVVAKRIVFMGYAPPTTADDEILSNAFE